MISRTAFFVAFLLVASPVNATTLAIARQYIGLHEQSDRAAIKHLIGVDPARIPWCGAFVTAVIRRAGRRPPKGSFMARSWLHYGKAVKLSQALPGDIVVTGRHVTFFHSRRGSRVCGIGGNQMNRVQLSCYAPGKVRGVRR